MAHYRQQGVYTGYAVAVACALALVAAWVFGVPYVPPGWPMVAVDGAGYMLSIVVMAGAYEQLKRGMRPFHSFLIAAATWGVIVVVFRGFLSGISG